MDRVARFIIRHARFVILVVLLLTLGMGYFATRIEIRAGIEDMFPASNPTVERFERANELFGGMTFAVVMLEDADVLDRSTLQKVADMTGVLEEVEGVQEVVSLTNVKQVKGNELGMEVSPLIEAIPEDAEEEQALRDVLADDQQYTGAIISSDYTATCILVKFEKDLADTMAPVQAITRLAEQYATPEKIYLTGNPVVVNDAQISLKQDIVRLLPFILIIMVLILWLSFRNWSGVVLPLMTVLISIVWTIGVMAIFGKPLSIISVVMPVLLVSVGSAYAIHLVARYQEELATGAKGQDVVRRTVSHVGVAVLIAGATTMAGFGSLYFTDLVIIREFALSTAFGIGVALVVSIFFIPAVYVQMHRKVKTRAEQRQPGMLDRWFESIFAWVHRRAGLIVGLVCGIVVIALLGIPRLYPETGYLNYFHENSSTKKAAELVDARFGGSATLDIIIKGDIKDPDLLRRMEAFQSEAGEIEGLNNPVSMVTLLKAANQALHGNDPAMNVIPDSREQIAQYLLLLTMSDQNTTKDYLTFDEQTTRIQFLMENMSGRRTRQALDQVDRLVEKHFANRYPVEVTGMPVMTRAISQMVIESQIYSIIASIFLTFVITSLLLRSMKRGLFCCLTILITVAVNFGVMGWFGIPLDIATTMIASIAVGIGVDYSIHIYNRYEEEKRVREDRAQALRETIRHVGRANLYNAVTVIAGFCVILLSSFPPLVNFGGLTAITMLVSFTSAIFLLPALILISEKRLKKRAYVASTQM